jgi:hypothetical protein
MILLFRYMWVYSVEHSQNRAIRTSILLSDAVPHRKGASTTKKLAAKYGSQTRIKIAVVTDENVHLTYGVHGNQ